MMSAFGISQPPNFTTCHTTILSLSIGAGDFSIWDFSGYEPYYMLYDHFLGDTNCLHLVTFSLQDTSDEQLAQVIFWLNFLKARVPPAMPIGQLVTDPEQFFLGGGGVFGVIVHYSYSFVATL